MLFRIVKISLFASSIFVCYIALSAYFDPSIGMLFLFFLPVVILSFKAGRTCERYCSFPIERESEEHDPPPPAARQDARKKGRLTVIK